MAKGGMRPGEVQGGTAGQAGGHEAVRRGSRASVQRACDWLNLRRMRIGMTPLGASRQALDGWLMVVLSCIGGVVVCHRWRR
jgi:hypothetical protein